MDLSFQKPRAGNPGHREGTGGQGSKPVRDGLGQRGHGPLTVLGVLRRPVFWLVGLFLFSLALCPLALRLRLEGNLIDLLPRSSQAAQAFTTFTRGFAAGQELIVLGVCSDPERLVQFADAYAEKLSQKGTFGQVSYKISGQSLRYLRDHLLLLLSEKEAGILRERLAEQPLRAQIRRLRGLLLAPGGSAMAPLLTSDPLELVPLLRGRLTSGLPVDAQSGYFRTSDGKALLFKIRPGFDPLNWERSRTLVQEAAELARSLGARVAGQGLDKEAEPILEDGTPTIAFTGSYAFAPVYRQWLEEDLSRSTTLSLVAVLVLFALFFRAVPLPRLLLGTAASLGLFVFAQVAPAPFGGSLILVGLSHGALFFLLLYAVRVLPAVLLSLAVSFLWTMAAASLLFGRINGVSLAFGTILVAIGIDLPIQIYNRVREEIAARDLAPKEAVKVAFADLAGPSIVATLGPAVVFLCCALSDYKGLSELGILAAVGLCLNCVVMLTLLPALLLVLPERLWQSKGTTLFDRMRLQNKERKGHGLLRAIGDHAAKHPMKVLLAALGLLLLSLPFASRLDFAEQLFSVQPRQMPPTVAQDEIAKRFGDRQRFLVAILKDRDRDQLLYRADRFIDQVEELRSQGLLRGYEGLSTLLPSQRTQKERIERLRSFNLQEAAVRMRRILEEEGFDSSAFEGFIGQLETNANPQGGQGSLDLEVLRKTELSFLIDSHLGSQSVDNSGTQEYLAAIYLFVPAEEGAEQAVSALQKISAGPAGGILTGVPILEPEFRRILRKDTVVLTLASVGLVVLLLVGYYRRVRPVLAVLLPLLLSWVLFAALLYLWDLSLNLYNLVVIPLCIGYGIDDHVFLVHRKEASGDQSPGVILDSTGRAIVLTSLATMAGFAGLSVAHFEGLRLLGLSGALAVLLCLFVAFFVLPALLQIFWHRVGSSGPPPLLSHPQDSL